MNLMIINMICELQGGGKRCVHELCLTINIVCTSLTVIISNICIVHKDGNYIMHT